MTYATRLRHEDVAFSFLSHIIEAYAFSISRRFFHARVLGLDLNLMNDERTLFRLQINPLLYVQQCNTSSRPVL
jgi:hypothetical protein